MRLNYLSPGGLRALFLIIALSLWAGCSSSPEEGEELENAENYEESAEVEGEEGAEGEQYAEEGGEYGEEGGNYAEEEGGEYAEGEQYAEDGLTEVAEGEETEADLQEIINELNENVGEGSGETYASEGDAGYNSVPAEGYGNVAAGEESVNLAEAPADNMVPANTAAPANNATASYESAGQPAVQMSGTFLPEMGSKMPYLVQKGDTLGRIAEKIYGSIEKWQEIQQLTNLDNPNRIYPGDVVYYQLSNQTAAFAQTYESTPRREVTVNQGDTLSSLASQIYGSSAAWKFIWRQNGHIDNPDRLEPGQVVYYIEYQGATLVDNGIDEFTTDAYLKAKTKVVAKGMKLAKLIVKSVNNPA